LIVLDANILIRAVLGARTHDLMERYIGRVSFVAPGLAFAEAEKHIPAIHAQRSASEAILERRLKNAEILFSRLREWVTIIPEDQLFIFRDAAIERLRKRDPNDWHILAASLAVNCPIWTEDLDFFGTGVPTWTTDRVEIYLRSNPATE
jgi:predicted nucleic acid-binding protein